MSITRMIQIDDIKPVELARYFSKQDGLYQAGFFNAVAEEFKSWSKNGCRLQMFGIRMFLNKKGKDFIQELYKYIVGD
ncbi:unnamed protein product [marine sediment metagenome]|uniref:Uncharacterized protein n=1 Tax=marine sediment metagenome TaxID=412755 RepID=X0TN14_9ZZZZ